MTHLALKELSHTKDRMKVAVAHYLSIGDLDDIVVAAGPDDLEIVKMDVTASEQAQAEVMENADSLFFGFGDMIFRDGGMSRLHGSIV